MFSLSNNPSTELSKQVVQILYKTSTKVNDLTEEK